MTHGARSHSKRDIASLVSNDCHIVPSCTEPESSDPFIVDTLLFASIAMSLVYEV